MTQWLHVFNIVLSAVLISFVSWLAGKKTGLAGFITALPVTTLIVLPLSKMQWNDSAQSVAYAKSIFVAIPISLLFFVPFLFAEKLHLNFWTCYLSGIALLAVGYFVHSVVFKMF